MHRLTHRLIAPEREGEVGNAAGHVNVGQFGPNAPRCLDIGDGVIVVLLDPGPDGEDIGIENDVFWREADLLCKQVISALAYGELSIGRLRLASFVESHDHNGRAIA